MKKKKEKVQVLCTFYHREILLKFFFSEIYLLMILYNISFAISNFELVEKYLKYYLFDIYRKKIVDS